MRDKPVFLTGSTGYVGGRLVPRLVEAGYAVRCYARTPEKLDDRPWRRQADRPDQASAARRTALATSGTTSELNTLGTM